MAYMIYATADTLRTADKDYFGVNTRTGIIETESGDVAFATVDPVEFYSFLDKGWVKTREEVEKLYQMASESGYDPEKHALMGTLTAEQAQEMIPEEGSEIENGVELEGLDRKVIEKMSKPELQQMAISKGIDVEGKTRPILIEEIFEA